MTENNTKIPAWEQQLDEIETMMTRLTEQRDQFKTLYEHIQRELALALMRIEELEGNTVADFTLKDVEVKKEMPDYSGGPAKVLKLTLEDQGGNTHQAEMFTMASTASPTIGQKLEGEISESDYGTKFSRGGAKKGGGFKKSPAETKAIQRQHSQEMMLREEQNRIALGQPLFTNDERQKVIDYYEDDIKGKAGTRGLVRFSDVPVDDDDLPFK